MACIITFARSWQALIATRALGKEGIKVITSDSDGFATSFFSRYSNSNFLYTAPHINEKKFVKDLIIKAKEYRERFDEEVMILPIHKETYSIARYKKQIEKYAKICINDYDKILEVHNKGNIIRPLKRYKIPHPKTYKIIDIIELYRIVPKLKFPVFLKLTESAASIGIVKIDERDELIYRYKKIIEEYCLNPKDYPIIQEGVEGQDYCVTAIANQGKIKAMMTYYNIKCHPYKSGPGVYRKNVSVPEMERLARKFLENIKWHGVIELDFRMGKEKKPYLIEANPRFWGGLNQSVASNVNYPLLAYEIATKGDCKTVKKYDKTVRTENLTTAIMALFDEIKKDERKQKELKKLYSYWRNAFKNRSEFIEYMQKFFKQINYINEKKYTYSAIKEFFQRRKMINQDDIIDNTDPFVVMGIFYPINLFLKYGKVDKEMLTGEVIQKEIKK